MVLRDQFRRFGDLKLYSHWHPGEVSIIESGKQALFLCGH